MIVEEFIIEEKKPRLVRTFSNDNELYTELMFVCKTKEHAINVFNMLKEYSDDYIQIGKFVFSSSQFKTTLCGVVVVK